MIITTSDSQTTRDYFGKITLPQADSHKGQNGKALIIGGSSLFHGAVLWSAESASAIVDMVHLASTRENNEIIRSLKMKWQKGMVIPQKDIPLYAKEDSVILIGNGMMRSPAKSRKPNPKSRSWDEILTILDEGEFTREAVHFLMKNFPDKQFVLDAGALQMMDKKWLSLLKKKAVITPHQKEFEAIFGINLSPLSLTEKEEAVARQASESSCIILLKAVDDIISDGSRTVRVQGGNAGLTKGGTGDILAGLVTGLCARSDPFHSAVVASLLLKKTSETVFNSMGFWYTATDILEKFPSVFHAVA